MRVIQKINRNFCSIFFKRRARLFQRVGIWYAETRK